MAPLPHFSLLYNIRSVYAASPYLNRPFSIGCLTCRVGRNNWTTSWPCFGNLWPTPFEALDQKKRCGSPVTTSAEKGHTRPCHRRSAADLQVIFPSGKQ